MLQTIVSSLKKRKNLITTAQNKIEIIFEIHFSSSLIIFMKNIVKFDYSSLIDDEMLITRREIMKIIHKINLNKIFKINEIINRALQHFARIIVKQIRFLFDRYIKEKI